MIYVVVVVVVVWLAVFLVCLKVDVGDRNRQRRAAQVALEGVDEETWLSWQPALESLRKARKSQTAVFLICALFLGLAVWLNVVSSSVLADLVKWTVILGVTASIVSVRGRVVKAKLAVPEWLPRAVGSGKRRRRSSRR